ncbi:ribonuclease domain-containing protein [Caldilinea sp.]|jgi:guanyl-specific ribonuclease Sa|uniref:ribonuclease domain-containing protein n=1 Tax=Caldilinea sp. TaxID=2293560 RepID=UPI0021DDF882|nr:ribonuclease domain-containing protein [Caldilinea sp.]GIV70322.1 MAG: hypothetical protein KatS3mg048_3184 [Caldilinea sp.]
MKRMSRGFGGLLAFVIAAALVIVWWRWSERPASTPPSEPPPLAIVATDANAATAHSSPPASSPQEQVAVPASADALKTPTNATTSAAASVESPPTGASTATPTRGPPERIDGLPVITLDELPPEALDTLALIERGGPFPFRQDGTIFQNRERRLPLKPAGYYREYTVITPGASTRGARRIVAGAGGELYYTDDHYASFRRIWKP